MSNALIENSKEHEDINRWILTDEIRDKYKPIIAEFLTRMESLTIDQINEMDNKEFCLKLSDTELRPYALWKLLEEEFGYGDNSIDNSSWEQDFWIYLCKRDKSLLYPSSSENLCINCCGMTFEMNLIVSEFM